MKRIKYWIAKLAAYYLQKCGNILLVYTDDIGVITSLYGDGNKIGQVAVNFADKKKDIFNFFAAVVLSYLVEYQTEEKEFLDRLKKVKKEATEIFRRPY